MLNCEFCNSKDFVKIGKVTFLKTECDAIMCTNCKNVIKDYTPNSDEFLEFYQNIDHDNEILYNNKLNNQLTYIKDNIRFDSVKSVLEVGPGPKGLISKLNTSIDRYSCEIDKNSIDVLNSKGVINFKTLEEIESKKFDLIILSHVFEHLVDDLDKYLLKLVSLLTEKGIIFIEVPSSEYELMIDDKKLINHYFSNGHKRSSTEKAFYSILNRLGVKNFKVSTSSHMIRNLEYKHRFCYSKIIIPFCLDKNARSYLFKSFFSFLYHLISSSIYSIIIKKRNIPQASIRVIIQNEN